MVRRTKLVNVGEDANENEIGMPPNNEGDDNAVGGFAPGVQEQIESAQASDPPVNSGDRRAIEATVESASASDGAPIDDEDLPNRDEADDEKTRNRQLRVLKRDMATIGSAYGAGKTSMISLAEAVTEAATKSIVGPEDAGMLYDIFRKNADSKATIDDIGLVPDEAIMEKAPNETPDKSRVQQVSKLGGFIRLGNKFDETAVELIRTARNMHLRLLAGDRKTVKPGSTYTILCAVAAAQMKPANIKPLRPLTEADLEALMTQEAREPVEKDGADKIIEAIKAVRAAQNGSDKRAPVTSDHLGEAMQSLRAAIGDAEDGDAKLAEYDAELKAVEDRKAEREQTKADREAKAQEEKAQGRTKNKDKQKAA